MSVGRAVRQAVTTNPQKSADAIVVVALKLVGGDEGQKLFNHTSKTLFYPDERRKAENTRKLPLGRIARNAKRYEGAPTLIGMVLETNS